MQSQPVIQLPVEESMGSAHDYGEASQETRIEYFSQLGTPAHALVTPDKIWRLLNWEHLAAISRAAAVSRLIADKHQSLKREVKSIQEYASKADWDGEGGWPVSEKTVRIALELIDKLPPDIEKPKVSATPHGEVDFYWIHSKDIMLTVSVDETGEIVFSGSFGHAEISGKEMWAGNLPGFVECCLKRLPTTG